MGYFSWVLPVGLAGAALGLGLGYVLRRASSGRMHLKESNSADCFKAALLAAAAIATGGLLGYVLLVKLPGPLNAAVFSFACWGFGEAYHRVFMKIFGR